MSEMNEQSPTTEAETPSVYGMKLNDLTPEVLKGIATIYHDVINPHLDLNSLIRTLNIDEINSAIKSKRSVEHRLGSNKSHGHNSKLWIEYKADLTHGQEVLGFTFDPNYYKEEDNQKEPLVEEFKRSVDKYFIENNLAVKESGEKIQSPSRDSGEPRPSDA